jgi:hypothetical protein
MTGPTFHAPAARDIEVIGVRPGDKLVLRPRVPITLEDAQAIAHRMADKLGPDWGVIVGDAFDLIVVRREDEEGA